MESFADLYTFALQIWKTCYAQGIGRHSIDEVEGIGKKDLMALSVFLADKQFFLGSSPTTVCFLSMILASEYCLGRKLMTI